MPTRRQRPSSRRRFEAKSRMRLARTMPPLEKLSSGG